MAKSELEVVKKYLAPDKPESYKIKGNIVFDGKQYSIRIPKKTADAFKIDPKKDKFEFEVAIPGELRGKLVRG